MKRSTWKHENGVVITITEGSAKPPAWALQMMGRVVRREVDRMRAAGILRWPTGGGIALRWTGGNGGGRFYAYGGNGEHRGPIVAVNCDGWSEEQGRYVLLHELAHWADWAWGKRYRSKPHGDGFHDALYRIARDEEALRLVQRWHTPKAPLTRAGRRWRDANRVCTRLHQEVREACDGTHEPGTEVVGRESWAA